MSLVLTCTKEKNCFKTGELCGVKVELTQAGHDVAQFFAFFTRKRATGIHHACRRLQGQTPLYEAQKKKLFPRRGQ